MKVIDLLNKIAKGEEVPKKIKYEEDIYVYIDNGCYYCDNSNLVLSDRVFAEPDKLNEEIEIIEEDEFEDIEHIISINFEEDGMMETESIINLCSTINGLIRNQKKIIEQLKNKD